MKKIVTLLVSLIWSLSVAGYVKNAQSATQLTAEFDKVVSSDHCGSWQTVLPKNRG